MKRLIRSFSHASDGIKTAFSTQANFRIHTFMAVVVIAAGVVFRLDVTEWAIIIVCIGSVIGAECINTAIEAAVDLYTSEYNEKAKIAKDCAAAGVLVVSIMSAVTGIIIFFSKLTDLIL
ncbi:MAG: diacylglycerol kinase family protein [Anaerofustis stercorihominis]|nr:diacylglycerol kinase family protein [Anaerofustis stercorihominis]